MSSLADIGVTSSHPDLTTMRQAEYAKIWQQIEKLEASIRVLKTQHNALGVTVRIPSEILCMIFEFVQAEKSRGSPWLFVTHVCAHWRKVAIDRPSFWRQVPFDIKYPILQEEMVSRAQGHSLDIKFSGWSSEKTTARTAQIALNNIHRIRTLSIHYTWTHLPDIMIHMIRSKPAPLLERLDIWRKTDDNFNLNNAFDGHAPRLLSLHLDNFDFLRESYILKNLTTFKLIDPCNPVPPDSILSVISNMPNLRILGLRKACARATKALQSVCLSQLHRLELDEDLPECISLLSHVKSSHPKPRFKIEAEVSSIYLEIEVPMMLDGVRDLANVLSQHILFHVRCLSVMEVPAGRSFPESYLTIQFDFWERLGTCLRPPSDAPCLSVGLRFKKNEEHCGPILAAFQGAIPNHYLETLHVSSLNAGQHDWWDVFGTLPILRNINVKYHRHAFFDALNAQSSTIQNKRPGSNNAEATAPAENPSELPFRALRCLVTQYFIYDEYYSDIDGLVTTLAERRKRGFPLREFHILNPIYLTPSTLERLQEVVEDVHVDPKKVWTPSE